MLSAQYTPKFERDVKSLKKKHFDIDMLGEVVNLALGDTEQSGAILRQRQTCTPSKASGRAAANAMSQTRATGL